ncbi:MAG: helix-turn-helix transcriptional regulator [Coriobacteriales bacterium]|jgi:DNA-binding CsgD family transcriptional regulator|nr:helix-turn-helix transcriptional regulator [Coriobacteriales bacterium]
MGAKPSSRLSIRFTGILAQPLRWFLGYAFVSAWTLVLYSSGVLIIDSNNLLPLSLIHLSSSGAVIITSALIAVLATQLTPLCRRRELLYLIATLGALATAGVVFVSSGVLGADWMFVFVALTAFSGVWLQIAWFELMATQGIRGTLFCLGVTAVVGTLLFLIITLIPQELGIVFGCLLPVLSLVSLRPLQSDRLLDYQGAKTGMRLTKRPRLGQLFRQTPLALTVTVGIVFFSYGAIRTLQLPVDPTAATLPDTLVSLAASLIAIGIALAIALYSYRMNAAIAFYIAIPCIIVASLLIGIPDSPSQLLPQTAVSTGTDLVRLLVFALFIELSITKRIPAIFLFALLGSIQFAGTLLGQLFAVLIAGNALVIALVVMVALVIAMLVLVAARRSLSAKGIAAQPGTTPALNDLAHASALTPREFEVLQIWISGHNSAYIEEQLHISKNTVKTHLSHIYAKTGTSNREELLTALENQKPAENTVL